MSFAYLAIYTGDYLRDTRHLTPLKHGVYLLALMHCWDSKGPMPLDEQECAGICNCRSSDEIEALRYVLNRFFVQMDDGWYNARIQREIERAHAIGLKRKSAGAKGYQARAKQLPSICQASASNTTPITIPTPTPTPEKQKNIVGQKPDAIAVLQFLNEKTGRNYRPVKANIEMIEARLKEGATVQELRQVVAKKTREWASDEKMAIYLRPATLFNRTKFAQYQGELLIAQGAENGMS